MLRCAALLSLLLATSCLDAPIAEDPATTGEVGQAILCNPVECGSNSPVIATYPFHDLNLDGSLNAEQFRVTSLRKANVDYQLEVKAGRISGRRGLVVLQGAGLVNAEIRVKRGTKGYAIRITQVRLETMHATLNGFERKIEAYVLDVSELLGEAPINEWRNLCRNPPSEHSPDLLGLNQYESLVFEGERIDIKSKSIASALNPRWFNIGCAGHALAKMAMDGHTQAAHDMHGFNTTILQRQAYLKMVTGDYCGLGKPFTVAGQPLQWQDTRGYTKYMSPLGDLEVEARWTDKGAICLNEPRINANPTTLGTAVFGATIVNQIIAECGFIPACTGGPDEPQAAYIVSANPL